MTQPRLGVAVRNLVQSSACLPALVTAIWLGTSIPSLGLELDLEIQRSTVPMPRALAVDDFDGDGVPDVVVAGALRELTIHLNKGASPRTFDGLTQSPRDVCVTDVDADGRDDLVVLYGENRLQGEQPELAVFRNVTERDTGLAFVRTDLDLDGMVRLVDPVLGREVPMGPKISPRSVAAGRINARPSEDDPRRWEVDRFPELIILDDENRVFVLLNEQGHFRTGIGYRLGVPIHDLHVAPLDDNESDDVLLAFEDPGNRLVSPRAEGGVDRPGGVLLLYSLQTPDALIGAVDRFYLRHVAQTDAVGSAVTTTDYDYDGDQDIVFTSAFSPGTEAASAHAVTVLNVFDEIVDPFRDPGLAELREFPLSNSSPVEILSGDFDNDLMGDILVRFENHELRFVPGHSRELLFGASETLVMPGVDGDRAIGVKALEYHGDGYPDLVVASSDGPDGYVSFLKNTLGAPVETALRGDVDGDPGLTLSDGVFLLDYLYREGASPECPVAADVNGDGSVDLSDAVVLLSYLFAGGPDPARWKPGVCPR